MSWAEKKQDRAQDTAQDGAQVRAQVRAQDAAQDKIKEILDFCEQPRSKMVIHVLKRRKNGREEAGRCKHQF